MKYLVEEDLRLKNVISTNKILLLNRKIYSKVFVKKELSNTIVAQNFCPMISNKRKPHNGTTSFLILL